MQNYRFMLVLSGLVRACVQRKFFPVKHFTASHILSHFPKSERPLPHNDLFLGSY